MSAASASSSARDAGGASRRPRSSSAATIAPARLPFSVGDDAADPPALAHHLEAAVYLLELQVAGDHRIDLDLARHVPVDDLWHVGAAARAAERRPLPDAPGDELERPGGNFLARAGDADDGRLAPAAMAGLQRLAHDGHGAGAVEGVVRAADRDGAAPSHVDEIGDEIPAGLLRIDEMRHAESLAPGLLAVVDVDADDHVGAGEPQALDDVEADAAEAEHDRRRALLDFRGVDDGADPGGDAAADGADLVEGSGGIDLGDGDFRQHGEGREGRAAHVVENPVAAAREARRAVRHHPLPLSGADRRAEVGLAREAGRALAAFGRVERNDVVALQRAGHARPDVDDHPRALVPEDGGKEPFRVGAGQGELVGVADAGRLDLDEDLAFAGPIEIDLRDLERLSGGDADSGAGFPRRFSLGLS